MGFRLQRMVGLATLHREDGVSKDWLESGGFEVQVAGTFYHALLQLAPLYDPTGEKMRA